LSQRLNTKTIWRRAGSRISSSSRVLFGSHNYWLSHRSWLIQ
jgi:hypothetical protein